MAVFAKKLKSITNKNSKIIEKNPIDLPFTVIVLILVVFGLIMVFSASTAYAYYRMEGNSYHYISQQTIFAFVGVICMFLISFVDYHILHKFAWPLMALTFILLIVVLFMPELNGAKRWIMVAGITMQPSEIAKFAVIVIFSHIMAVNYNKMNKFMYGVAPFMIILALIAVLMLQQPHLSGTILIFGIGVAMMFIGGTRLIYFIAALAVLASGVVFAIASGLVAYAESRLANWIDPLADTSGGSYQTIQSMYAISSGGLFGLGLGNSRQKHLYVPEPANDFIFAILCEELGFIGAMVVILLFVFLMIRGLYIAFNAADKFGCMLVVGIMVQVVLQAALNIAVVTNTVPNTGISLPFFSYGGTSLLMLLGEMGIVLSVSRQSSIYKT